jgi:uncharacterized protein (DUF305 family)
LAIYHSLTNLTEDNSMKITWTFSVLLTAGVLLGQAPPSSDQFMRDMEASMTKMDKGMADAPMNGDVDHDFATMMIPHHAGAIDMAKAELAYGKDPVLRRLAEEIIVDQQSEIDAMNRWLGKKKQ